MTAIPATVLADLVPGRGLARPLRVARAVTLATLGALFLAVVSQIAIPLPFTPVPVSLATGAVVLIGAGLGPRLSALSTGMYVVAGIAGAPVFAEQSSGWAFASFGYALGYIPAAVIAGVLARRAADRSVWKTAGLAGLSTLAVFAVGLPWLMGFLGVDLMTGLALGFFPFLIGDALKMIAAALLLPGAWKLVDRFQGEN
ncbi:MAG TPA: biotin transporter BioY [Beutenbergiaceae bacterium]|nr:biotin transporter BioY [Beutenbergiaceae bacterium]